MPNYAVVRNRMASYGEAASLLPRLQQIYAMCQEVDDAITLYQAGTNADFNQAVDAIFVPAERQQLAAMLNNVQQLVSVWATNHAVLLEGEAGPE